MSSSKKQRTSVEAKGGAKSNENGAISGFHDYSMASFGSLPSSQHDISGTPMTIASSGSKAAQITVTHRILIRGLDANEARATLFAEACLADVVCRILRAQCDDVLRVNLVPPYPGRAFNKLRAGDEPIDLKRVELMYNSTEMILKDWCLSMDEERFLAEDHGHPHERDQCVVPCFMGGGSVDDDFVLTPVASAADTDTDATNAHSVAAASLVPVASFGPSRMEPNNIDGVSCDMTLTEGVPRAPSALSLYSAPDINFECPLPVDTLRCYITLANTPPADLAAGVHDAFSYHELCVLHELQDTAPGRMTLLREQLSLTIMATTVRVLLATERMLDANQFKSDVGQEGTPPTTAAAEGCAVTWNPQDNEYRPSHVVKLDTSTDFSEGKLATGHIDVFCYKDLLAYPYGDRKRSGDVHSHPIGTLLRSASALCEGINKMMDETMGVGDGTDSDWTAAANSNIGNAAGGADDASTRHRSMLWTSRALAGAHYSVEALLVLAHVLAPFMPLFSGGLYDLLHEYRFPSTAMMQANEDDALPPVAIMPGISSSRVRRLHRYSKFGPVGTNIALPFKNRKMLWEGRAWSADLTAASSSSSSSSSSSDISMAVALEHVLRIRSTTSTSKSGKDKEKDSIISSVYYPKGGHHYGYGSVSGHRPLNEGNLAPGLVGMRAIQIAAPKNKKEESLSKGDRDDSSLITRCGVKSTPGNPTCGSNGAEDRLSTPPTAPALAAASSSRNKAARLNDSADGTRRSSRLQQHHAGAVSNISTSTAAPALTMISDVLGTLSISDPTHTHSQAVIDTIDDTYYFHSAAEAMGIDKYAIPSELRSESAFTTIQTIRALMWRLKSNGLRDIQLPGSTSWLASDESVGPFMLTRMDFVEELSYQLTGYAIAMCSVVDGRSSSSSSQSSDMIGGGGGGCDGDDDNDNDNDVGNGNDDEGELGYLTHPELCRYLIPWNAQSTRLVRECTWEEAVKAVKRGVRGSDAIGDDCAATATGSDGKHIIGFLEWKQQDDIYRLRSMRAKKRKSVSYSDSDNDNDDDDDELCQDEEWKLIADDPNRVMVVPLLSLAPAPSIALLLSLSLPDCGLTDGTFGLLFFAPYENRKMCNPILLRCLRYLDVSRNSISAHGVIAGMCQCADEIITNQSSFSSSVASSGKYGRNLPLQELVLSGNPLANVVICHSTQVSGKFDTAMLCWLVRSTRILFPNLKRMELASCLLGGLPAHLCHIKHNACDKSLYAQGKEADDMEGGFLYRAESTSAQAVLDSVAACWAACDRDGVEPVSFDLTDNNFSCDLTVSKGLLDAIRSRSNHDATNSSSSGGGGGGGGGKDGIAAHNVSTTSSPAYYPISLQEPAPTALGLADPVITGESPFLPVSEVFTHGGGGVRRMKYSAAGHYIPTTRIHPSSANGRGSDQRQFYVNYQKAGDYIMHGGSSSSSLLPSSQQQWQLRMAAHRMGCYRQDSILCRGLLTESVQPPRFLLPFKETTVLDDEARRNIKGNCPAALDKSLRAVGLDALMCRVLGLELAHSRYRFIRKLDLSGNDFGDTGVIALASTVAATGHGRGSSAGPHHSSISHVPCVVLRNVGMTESSAFALNDLVRLWGVRNLDISRNHLGMRGMAWLLELLCEDPPSTKRASTKTRKNNSQHGDCTTVDASADGSSWSEKLHAAAAAATATATASTSNDVPRAERMSSLRTLTAQAVGLCVHPAPSQHHKCSNAADERARRAPPLHVPPSSPSNDKRNKKHELPLLLLRAIQARKSTSSVDVRAALENALCRVFRASPVMTEAKHTQTDAGGGGAKEGGGLGCLYSLDFSFNDIDEGLFSLLQEELSLSLCVTDLRLRSVGMDKVAAFKFLPGAIADNRSNLRALDLSCNRLCGIRSVSFDPRPIRTFADKLIANTSLQYLNLSGSDVGARATHKLFSALSINTTLQTLILDGCNCSEDGGEHIGEALPDLHGIMHLSVAECMIGPIGCTRLFLGLMQNRSLQSLNVSGNQLSTYHQQDSFSLAPIIAIAEGLAANETLRDVNLSNNGLFGVFFDTQSESNGTFDPCALKILADGLIRNGNNNGSLESVNITGNRFGNSSDVCEYCCRQPTHMWKGLVPDCYPECPACMPVTHLLTAVDRHRTLHTLVGIERSQSRLAMSGLRLCVQWMRVVAAELRRHQWLTTVDLNTNYFNPRCTRVLARALECNVAMTSLYLPRMQLLNRLERKPEVPIKSAALYLECEVGRAKHQAFLFRLVLARLVRRLSCVGADAAGLVLEFLLGAWADGVIDKFLRYRSRFSSLPV
jgi:hypothetical protein